MVNDLQAFCALQAPRRPPSSSPSSERGRAAPARCLAAPTTPPDRRPPYRSRSGCCPCPPGTSAVEEGGTLPPSDCCGDPSPSLPPDLSPHTHPHLSTYLFFQCRRIDNQNSVLRPTPQLSSHGDHFGDGITGCAEN